MKRLLLISVVAATSLVAACGEGDQNVSRNQGAPLDLTPAEPAQPGYFSSRSALDLLSFG